MRITSHMTFVNGARRDPFPDASSDAYGRAMLTIRADCDRVQIEDHRFCRYYLTPEQARDLGNKLIRAADATNRISRPYTTEQLSALRESREPRTPETTIIQSWRLPQRHAQPRSRETGEGCDHPKTRGVRR